MHIPAQNVTLARPMAGSRTKRRRDLSAMARQANHVLATAVVVFTAAVLLGRLLEPWMLSLQAWLRAHVGANVTAMLFGPFIVDLPKALILLLVAFPLGRVTAPRPWPAAIGLVGLVYLCDFSIDYVLGAHHITWLQWKAATGRGLLAVGIIWGVAWLLARGRRAAETADRKGAALVEKPAKPRKKKPSPEAQEAADDPPPESADPEDGDPTCKRKAGAGVSKGEP